MLALPLLTATLLAGGGDGFSANVDHRFFPLKPRTRWVYRESPDLRVVVTATSVTRLLANGITARVVRDTVFEDGKAIEDTFDWYAQDEDGAVWYMGEDTAEFENGRLVTKEGSWEAGVDGAEPGVIMPARPRRGMRYRQEYYEGHAEDRARVLDADRRILLTRDTTPLEPKVLEYKLYKPRRGLVLTVDVSGGREVLQRIVRVSAAKARAAGTVPLGERY